MASLFHPHVFSFFIFFFSFVLLGLAGAAAALDRVPEKNRFRFVNQGEFVDAPAEYGADYRAVGVVGSPFQLTFYNTTPNAYRLAIRMGTPRSESVRRWVWEANRSRPVRENATVSLGADGNLVLADADGAVVWSTGTANKGVVGIQILHSGNMVLYDKKGRYLWQSFDHPTDTLLVGQSLPAAGAAKLVSRKSESDGSPGIYSLVVESGQPVLFLEASPSRSLPYFNLSRYHGASTDPAIFECSPRGANISYVLSFGSLSVQTKYDSSLSFLRLTPEGDVEFYTYDDRVYYRAWQKTFALFDEELSGFSACERPSRCGKLGVCEGKMCTACPAAKGTGAWSPACAPPRRRRACRPGASSSYIKVAGVEHFLTRNSEGEGKMTMGECRRRCNVDCDCLGFLYWEESSQCWLAPVLGTLNKVNDPKHAAYIKSS
ncbi:unnamed protein product [Spirodela intermedia]|uniref:Bulb-type lectin domain-containing protein n=1 Tax=Spirodela intermedia TaxID=51605 RepID=A0A7I8KAD1_SPIIN|nr:unnamed protein product [Spirodela intermedia]